MMKVPEKGDLVILDFSPQKGSEQAGRRPAIVLSPSLFNRGRFVAVCPITTKKKGYPFEIELPDTLKVQGVILSDQLRTLDWRERNLVFVDRAPEAIVYKCLRYINRYLNFE